MIRFDFFSQRTRRFSLYFIVLLCLQKHAWGTDKIQQAKIDSLRSVIASCVQDTTCANTLLALSDCYRNINTDSALFWAQKLISFSQEKKIIKYIGKGFIVMGNIYRLNMNYEKAKKSYFLAEKQCRLINDIDGVARSIGGILACHILVYSPTDSVQLYFDKIMEIKYFVKDKNLIGNAYLNYSSRFVFTGEYYIAVANLMSAISIFEKTLDEEGVLYAKTTLGVVYHEMKNDDKAIAVYNEIAPKAFKQKSNILYVNLLMNLAVSYDVKKDYVKSADYIRKALYFSEKYNIRERTDILYTNMANLQVNIGQPDSAIYFSTKAIQAAGAFSDYSHLANLSLASGYVGKNKFELAEKYAQGYLKHQLEKKEMTDVSNAYQVLILLYKKWKKYNRACDYYDLDSKLKDTLFNEANAKKVADMETFYWSSKKRNELALAKKNEELRTNEVKQANIENQLYSSQRNGLIIAIILVIIFSVLLYRINLQRRKNKLMQQVTELELKAIRAQMNPHFLFNALSAIQMLINKNDIKQSNIALAKFGKLMRLILENSEKQTVSLEDEIKTLKLYIELEALRFPFNYNLSIDPELDQENMEIPSMIIQPYIENAIKHGISTKHTDRNVNISFTRQNNNLFCTVEDDGVGREMAEASKSKYANHKSMGTKLSKDRLELIGKQMSGKAEVRIKDLHTDQGIPSGTLVELNIPITYHAN